jgi:hypothetical protein
VPTRKKGEKNTTRIKRRWNKDDNGDELWWEKNGKNNTTKIRTTNDDEHQHEEEGTKNMTRIRHQTKTRTLIHTTGKGKMEKGSKD